MPCAATRVGGGRDPGDWGTHWLRPVGANTSLWPGLLLDGWLGWPDTNNRLVELSPNIGIYGPFLRIVMRWGHQSHGDWNRFIINPASVQQHNCCRLFLVEHTNNAFQSSKNQLHGLSSTQWVTSVISVQPLNRMGRGGDMRDDSAKIIFQFLLRETIVGSTGTGKKVHSLTLSVCVSTALYGAWDWKKVRTSSVSN